VITASIRSSSIVRGAPGRIVRCKPPRQLAISLDRPALNGMTLTDRNTAMRCLARLLMEAAGADPEEISDDER
jgi:hypothetical protein